MANTIKLKRGLKANLPVLEEGEPAFCTDTKEMFVGAAGGNTKIGDFVVSSKFQLIASSASSASLNIPQGTTPTSPVNGDIWTTAESLFSYLNGNIRTIYHSGNAPTANLTTASQAEAEAGTSTTVRGWTPQRIAQAARGVLLTGFSAGANTAIGATDTLIIALGKLQAQISAKANLASPSFTGTPLAPTAPVATNNTQIATTAFVKLAIPNISQNLTIDGGTF